MNAVVISIVSVVVGVIVSVGIILAIIYGQPKKNTASFRFSSYTSTSLNLSSSSEIISSYSIPVKEMTCKNPPPSNPIITTRNNGIPLDYDGEHLTIKYQSPEIALFTIITAPNWIGQQHLDKNTDQFYFVQSGSYSITYTDVLSGTKTTKNITDGDLVFVKKGTTFQLKNLRSTPGTVFGGLLPGYRINLVKELAEYQKAVGVNNLDINKILEIESRYCVFE